MITFSGSNIVDVEFYFKCHGQDHRADEEGQNKEQAPPLHLIRPNVRQVGLWERTPHLTLPQAKIISKHLSFQSLSLKTYY